MRGDHIVDNIPCEPLSLRRYSNPYSVFFRDWKPPYQHSRDWAKLRSGVIQAFQKFTWTLPCTSFLGVIQKQAAAKDPGMDSGISRGSAYIPKFGGFGNPGIMDLYKRTEI